MTLLERVGCGEGDNRGWGVGQWSGWTKDIVKAKREGNMDGMVGRWEDSRSG